MRMHGSFASRAAGATWCSEAFPRAYFQHFRRAAWFSPRPEEAASPTSCRAPTPDRFRTFAHDVDSLQPSIAQNSCATFSRTTRKRQRTSSRKTIGSVVRLPRPRTHRSIERTFTTQVPPPQRLCLFVFSCRPIAHAACWRAFSSKSSRHTVSRSRSFPSNSERSSLGFPQVISTSRFSTFPSSSSQTFFASSCILQAFRPMAQTAAAFAISSSTDCLMRARPFPIAPCAHRSTPRQKRASLRTRIGSRSGGTTS